MARKKYFFVFCAIFLTAVSLLSVGAWLTRVEIEQQAATNEAGGPPALRLADPPPEAPPPR